MALRVCGGTNILFSHIGLAFLLLIPKQAIKSRDMLLDIVTLLKRIPLRKRADL